jgi:hypothetical protein
MEHALGGKPPQLISLSPLSLEHSVQLIQHHAASKVSIADATIIANQYGLNPQILEIIATAVRDDRMSVEEAKQRPNVAGLAGGDNVIEKVSCHPVIKQMGRPPANECVSTPPVIQ